MSTTNAKMKDHPEPTAAELLAIEAEAPVLAAELNLVVAECQLAADPCEVAARRVEQAEDHLAQVLISVSLCLPHQQDEVA